MVRRAPTVAAGGALVALAVLVAVVVGQRDRHLVSSNYVRPIAFVTDVPAGRQACQTAERVPAGAGAVRLRIGTKGLPGPALRVRLTGDGPPLEGSIRAGWRQGDVEVPIAPTAGERRDVRLCVANRGPSWMTVAGEVNPLPLPGAARPDPAEVASRPSRGLMRVEYLESRSTSWFGFADTLADRVATVRHAVPGALSFWLWGLLALAAIGGSVVLVVREADR